MDPILMAECFVGDFKRGYWDEFDEPHILRVCSMLLEKLDNMNVEKSERRTKVEQDISSIEWVCWNIIENEKEEEQN